MLFKAFEKKIEQKETLNVIQKQIIEATISYYIADIEEISLPNEKTLKYYADWIMVSKFYKSEQIDPPNNFEKLKSANVIHFLELVSSEFLTIGDVQEFERNDILSDLKIMRNIINHPCPQNRYQGDGNAYCVAVLKGRDPNTQEEINSCNTGVSEGVVYYYESGFGSKILMEQSGILGLSARNDSSTPPVTKEAVVYYMKQLINKAIEKYKSTLIENKEFNNHYQLAACTILSHLGLNNDHLSNQEWFDTRSHLQALIYLMKKRHFKADDAIAELRNLSQQQCMGICDGLRRTDLIGLKQFQILALRELHAHGLTANHLKGQDWFNTNICKELLVKLIKTDHLSIDDAMIELKNQLTMSSSDFYNYRFYQQLST